MKNFLFVFCIFISLQISAQTPEDALRLSWIAPSGTARQQAIGGAMGSLGGEITSTFVNPAGIGMYKTSEVVFSPGFYFQKDKSDYLGVNSSGNNKSNFNIGASGFVFGIPGPSDNHVTISVAVNRAANFGGNTYYKGQNNYSSFSEQYAEEFANSGLSIDQAINSQSISYGTRSALYTYLVDTATVGGSLLVIGQPQKVLAANGQLTQVNNISTKGGITEAALSLAGNSKDKWMYGISIGVPIVNYTKNTVFTESDASGNTNNDFSSSTYQETYTSKGAGVNFKLGGIFNASPSWRVGLAVHSPSFYVLTDKISTTMRTNTENYAPETTITSQELDGGSSGSVKYQIASPWRFIGSVSYLFGGGVADVKQQKGFVTADVEYVTTRSSKFSSPKDENGYDLYDQGYFDGVNNVVKSYYKNNFNFRVGGELKFNTIAARAGFAYSMNPYKESELKADRMYISGGLGYRNKGVFVDVTYVLGFVKDVNFPYRLADKSNVYAVVKQTTGTALLTVGFKF
ncbi:MAG: hypothetical protein JST75_06960 [Bacteroidetes bacterium]|nr:hypothetical protein [Bacteroidota bacterium]